MFIARISKGRTVREFVLAVLLIPSILSFIWLSVFGASAMYIDKQIGGKLFDVVKDNLPIALFEMIRHLDVPILAGTIKVILSIIGTILVVSFFVTSSDSGSLVVDNITSGGKLDSPIPQRVFWACMEGFVAAILLLIGGEKALSTLQTAVISTGLPFAIILTIMGILLIESVYVAFKKQRKIRYAKLYKEVVQYHLQKDNHDIKTKKQ